MQNGTFVHDMLMNSVFFLYSLYMYGKAHHFVYKQQIEEAA